MKNNHLSNSEYIGIGIVVILLFSSICYVHAQDSSELIIFFNEQFIPVEEINVENGVVVVKYKIGPLFGPEKIGKDISYIFGKIAKEFPNSDTIRIEGLVGEDILFEYEIDTKDVLDYVSGKLSDDEIISKIRVKDFTGQIMPGDEDITSPSTDPSTPPCTGTSTYAYIESRTMENGKEVRIPVMMCNANDLANMDFSVSYDPNVLRFKDAEKGSLNSNFLFESNEISSGNVKLSFASSKGVSGSGSIAILIFDVVGSNGDSSILTGSVNTADTSSGSPISITIKPGKVTVGSTTAGDCDGDGLVTSKDALTALQMSVGKIKVDLCYDVTGDGKVSSDDARDILKKAVKK